MDQPPELPTRRDQDVRVDGQMLQNSDVDEMSDSGNDYDSDGDELGASDTHRRDVEMALMNA